MLAQRRSFLVLIRSENCNLGVIPTHKTMPSDLSYPLQKGKETSVKTRLLEVVAPHVQMSSCCVEEIGEF
jgi:hypothetical protein